MTRKSEETEQNFGNVVTPPQNSTDLQEILSDQNSIQMDLINSDTESEHDHTNKKSITDTVTTELSESSPLLTHHDNKQTTLISTPNKTAGSIGCLVLCISGISVAIFLSIRSFDSSQKPNLKFKFKTPYAGGGTILISNEGNHDVEIQNIQFKINGIIDTNKKGSIYGDLAPWGEATIQAEKTDGIWTTYNIKEPSNKDPVILKAGKTSNCTYVFGSAKGTLDVGVMPDEVSVTIDKNEYQLALADRCQEAHCEDPVPEHHLGGFYTDWDMYQRQYNVEDIPIDKINHVYYAFLSYDKLGNLALLDSNSDNIQLPMLMQLQKQYPYLKVMLSVGGATNSADFPALAANPVARENFARNLVAVLDQFSFSGIDIDWETPNSDEASDFIALLKVIRQTMDATGKQYKLTIAAPAGKQHIDAIGEQWQQVADVVDAINVMAYDYNGPWSEKSDYQSPVALPPNDPLGQQNSLDATRSYYQQYKVNTAKINLGMPAYFRGVTVANMQNNGMWQTVTGTPEGQFDNSGVFDYRCAVKQDCNSGNTLPEDAEYLSVDKAPYGNFSETPMFKSNNVKAVYTGDSVTSVKAKSTLVKKNNYQGVFFWTLSGDVRHDDTSSLVVQAQQVLSGEKKIASKAPAPQNSEPDLSFDYSIPYQGAGKLTIHNKSNQPKTIKKLVFDSNVNISGTPYGSLWKYGATITAEDNPDGITKTYTISETEAGIVIPANTELDLTFSYQSVIGPLNLSSIPKKVTVDLAGEPAPIALPIEGKCQDTDCIDPSPDKSINGYYTSWAQYARKYNAVDIPVRTLNQVTYAFIGYDKSGNIHLLDPYSDGKQLLALATLRQQYPYLNVCLSFGGWSLSNDFSALSANEAALDNFVNNVIAAVKQLGANGIDIDWEYPVVKSGNPADASNFAKMLTKLRAGLDSLSEQKTILSIAAPGGVDKIQAIQKADPTAWTQIAASVDQLNIMSYDYHGAWDQYSAPMSALRSDPRSPYAANPVVNKYDVVDTVNAYKALGVFRSEQMNIGFPAYGRLVNINEIGDRFGLWQEITGTPPGEYDATGVFDYRCIKASECHGLRKLPADIRFVNPEDTTYGSYSQTPWAYGPQSLTYLSFDDAASVERKAEYVKKNGLGGMMCWDLSGDLAATNQDSLIATVHNAFSSQQNARAMLASKTDSVIDSGDFSETQTSAAARLESPLTTLFAISLSSTTNCRNTDSTLTYFVLVKNAFSETYAWLHQQFSAYTTQRPEPKMPWLDRGAETSTAEQPCRYFDGSTNVITDYGIDSMGIKHRLASGSVEPNTALIPQCQQTKPWITQDSINTLGTMFYSGLLGLLYGAANKGLELAISSRLDIAPKKTKNIIWGINLTVMAYGIYQGANVFAVLMPLAVNNTVRWGATRLGASQYLSIGLSVLASAGVGYWQSDSELFLWSWAVSHLCYFVGEQLVSWAANRPEKTDTTAASRQGLFAQVRYDADAVEPESTRGNTLPFFQRPFFCF